MYLLNNIYSRILIFYSTFCSTSTAFQSISIRFYWLSLYFIENCHKVVLYTKTTDIWFCVLELLWLYILKSKNLQTDNCSYISLEVYTNSRAFSYNRKLFHDFTIFNSYNFFGILCHIFIMCYYYYCFPCFIYFI